MMEKNIRRGVRRALKPTGLIGKRGPALDVRCLVRKVVKEEVRLVRVHTSVRIEALDESLGGSFND